MTVWTRLVLAVAVTFTCLPYAFGRSLVGSMLFGRPEWLYATILVAGVAAVIGLTYRLSQHFPDRRSSRWIGLTLTIGWIATAIILILMATGPSLPGWTVAAGYVPASLSVPWVAWMFYGPLRWRTRGTLLLASLLPLALFVSLYRVQGLTGDNQVNFNWRRQPSRQQVSTTNGGHGPVQPIELGLAQFGDFPQFLGPERNAAQTALHLARDWAVNPPRELWRRPVGTGWGSFAVVGNYAFTQEQRGPLECVVCYNLTSGDEVWLHSDAIRFEESMGGPGPRTTPTIHDGRIYTVGPTGLLNRLDGSTGHRLWSIDILEDNGAANTEHGVCGSPLVVDDFVVVAPTGEHGPSLAAYDLMTGRRVWAAGAHRASYSSPMLAEIASRRMILLYDTQGVAAHDVESGNLLWRVEWSNSQRVNCSQPVTNAGVGNRILVSTGYGGGSAVFAVRPAEDGTWTTRQVWKINTHLNTKFTTAVAIGDHAYGLNNGILQCVNLMNGRTSWKHGRYGHGQILLVGDLLVVQTELGDVVLVSPSPQSPDELGTVQALTSKTWNCPVVASPDPSAGSAYLLVRNDREAVCYEVRLREAAPADATPAATPASGSLDSSGQ